MKSTSQRWERGENNVPKLFDRLHQHSSDSVFHSSEDGAKPWALSPPHTGIILDGGTCLLYSWHPRSCGKDASPFFCQAKLTSLWQ